MTFEQANNMIDDISWSYGGEIITKQDMIECRETCHEALEKQIPKKVTHEASIFECCTCPNCKNVVDEFTDFNGQRVRVTYNNCKFCGQALDFGNDTE